jgi:hypothetical protein
VAGLDAPTAFSMDAIGCAPVNEPCGPVTIRYDKGTGNRAGDNLNLVLTGNASGCGISAPFTLTFTGTLVGSPAGGNPDGGVPDGGVSDAGVPDAGVPDAGSDFTPVSIELQSDPGDYVGAGKSYAYTKADSTITVTSSGGLVALVVNGDEKWQSDFQMPSGFTQLQPGAYDVQRYPFNGSSAGLDWFGEGRGCNTLTGSVTVDSARYTNGTLTAFELHFEQHCEGAASALHGHIVWDANDPTVPPGPIEPSSDLWQPAPGATPASGDYVYLQSDPGDFIGGGNTMTFTPSDATISLSGAGNHASVSITGTQYWNGDFQGMSSIAQLQPGYYGDLERYGFANPARGGLDWYGESRGCNTLTGWFVVDGIRYTGTTPSSLDLRFEQHCDGNSAALHGQIHWSVSGG